MHKLNKYIQTNENTEKLVTEDTIPEVKANKTTKEVKPFTRTELIKFLNQLPLEEPSQYIEIIRLQILMGTRIRRNTWFNY